MAGSARSFSSCACSAARSASRSTTAYLFPNLAVHKQSGLPLQIAAIRTLSASVAARARLLARWLLAEAALEPGDPAAGVQDLLLARVERVAVRADIGVD